MGLVESHLIFVLRNILPRNRVVSIVPLMPRFASLFWFELDLFGGIGACGAVIIGKWFLAECPMSVAFAFDPASILRASRDCEDAHE